MELLNLKKNEVVSLEAAETQLDLIARLVPQYNFPSCLVCVFVCPCVCVCVCVFVCLCMRIFEFSCKSYENNFEEIHFLFVNRVLAWHKNDQFKLYETFQDGHLLQARGAQLEACPEGPWTHSRSFTQDAAKPQCHHLSSPCRPPVFFQSEQ